MRMSQVCLLDTECLIHVFRSMVSTTHFSFYNSLFCLLISYGPEETLFLASQEVFLSSIASIHYKKGFIYSLSSFALSLSVSFGVTLPDRATQTRTHTFFNHLSSLLPLAAIFFIPFRPLPFCGSFRFRSSLVLCFEGVFMKFHVEEGHILSTRCIRKELLIYIFVCAVSRDCEASSAIHRWQSELKVFHLFFKPKIVIIFNVYFCLRSK